MVIKLFCFSGLVENTFSMLAVNFLRLSNLLFFEIKMHSSFRILTRIVFKIFSKVERHIYEKILIFTSFKYEKGNNFSVYV